MLIKVRILSAQKFIGDFEADEVVLPGKTGQIGALNNHTGLFTALDIGLVRIKFKGKWIPVIVSGGFAEISRNRIVVLATGTEEFEGVSLKKATEELNEAIRAFTNMEITPEKSSFDLSVDLKKATAQLLALNYLSLNSL